jgi:hypothetical protein
MIGAARRRPFADNEFGETGHEEGSRFLQFFITDDRK